MYVSYLCTLLSRLIVVTLSLTARTAQVVSTSVRKTNEQAAPANPNLPAPATGEALKAATIGSETAKGSTKTKETKAKSGQDGTGQDIQLSDDSESEVPIHT